MLSADSLHPKTGVFGWTLNNIMAAKKWWDLKGRNFAVGCNVSFTVFDEAEHLSALFLLDGFLEPSSYQKISGNNKDHPYNKDRIIFLYHAIGNCRDANGTKDGDKDLFLCGGNIFA